MRESGIMSGDPRPIIEAMRLWAHGHPAADQPFLIVKGKAFTPKEFLHEVEERTEFGLSFLRFLFEEASRHEVAPESLLYKAIKANQSR
jgi:hypothetical protein